MLNRILVGHSELKIRETRQNEDMLCKWTCILCLSIVIWSHECPWTYIFNPYSVWLENFPLAFSFFMHMKLAWKGARPKAGKSIEAWTISNNMTIINVTISFVLVHELNFL